VGETFFWGKRKCHWWREIRMASNKQNWRKHCKNSSNCAWKSSADCQEHSRASEHQQRNSQENLNWRSWHEEDVCKNGLKGVHRTKSKEESQFVKILWRGKMTFWAVSSQVMKHGSTNTTLKQSNKVHNGRLPIPHNQKNSISPNQESKQWCWLFLILEVLFIMNLYRVDKQSTKFTMWKILKRLREKVRRKRPELSANSWILHHGNAPAHMALSVREFLATKQITVLEHPAYSQDLAPSDFFLFPKIKEILKGRNFDDTDDISSSTMDTLKAIPQNQFQNCSEGWTRHWHRCIHSQEEYTEGNHGGIQHWGV